MDDRRKGILLEADANGERVGESPVREKRPEQRMAAVGLESAVAAICPEESGGEAKSDRMSN
ncbi:UNVERIFIED_CONTAM: hypothetical protein Sradi_1390400 [Sesamum radiatum]|uniref:Uncharacterized protein n=1 Tax=Sesamum radiatum TaxID=300843 RepID=A0AAW2UR58_SESRA